VQTRRETVILMTAIPLLSTDAVAQSDRVAPPDRQDALFNNPAENLSVPSRVRQRYAILAYYIQLLNLQGPMRSREDIAAAIKTYQLVGESIARSDAKFEGEVHASFVQSLREAFSKSEEELWAFLRQVGIDPRLLAARVIEESLASNMLFYGAETRVTNVNDLLWCCYPFCFRRPT
jgi:hypothetical protein